METQKTEDFGAHLNMKGCIDACLNAERNCIETMTHCLALGGMYGSRDRIRMLLDCANLTGLNAQFMMRGSDFYQMTCDLTAKVSSLCSVIFEDIDDPIISKCVKACQLCTATCQYMATQNSQNN